jgi:GWxTD domain-containing protein
MIRINNTVNKLFLVLICVILSVGTVTSQSGTNAWLPIFFYDIVRVDSPEPGMSRFFIYLKTAFDELTFVREDSVFKASYEVSLIIADKKNFQVDGKVWQEEVIAKNFQQTNTRKTFSLSYQKFDLEPGDYKISVGFTDLETKQTRTIKQKIKLKDLKKTKLAVSELAFVRNIEVDSLGVKSFSPEVANYLLDFSNNLYAYFEIYSKETENKKYEIFYTIKNAKGKKVFQDKYIRRVDGTRTMEYFSLAKGNLPQGQYELKVKVIQGRKGSETTKKFTVRWADLPSTVEDIDRAVEQLKYIADKKDWDKLRKTDRAEKLNAFKEFWGKRDPSPGTSKNERMDEYYNRVAYANHTFTGFREGWKSDMGMIFIIFGPPSDIERHPFDTGSKPYEIWYYYTINRNFTFQDRTGFGEYKLLTENWHEWRSLIQY